VAVQHRVENANQRLIFVASEHGDTEVGFVESLEGGAVSHHDSMVQDEPLPHIAIPVRIAETKEEKVCLGGIYRKA
jgi:hypothetical protein